jgi:hypothetical protein
VSKPVGAGVVAREPSLAAGLGAHQDRQVAPARRRAHQPAQLQAAVADLIEHQRARLRGVERFQHQLGLMKHL